MLRLLLRDCRFKMTVFLRFSKWIVVPRGKEQLDVEEQYPLFLLFVTCDFDAIFVSFISIISNCSLSWNNLFLPSVFEQKHFSFFFLWTVAELTHYRNYLRAARAKHRRAHAEICLPHSASPVAYQSRFDKVNRLPDFSNGQSPSGNNKNSCDPPTFRKIRSHLLLYTNNLFAVQKLLESRE